MGNLKHTQQADKAGTDVSALQELVQQLMGEVKELKEENRVLKLRM